MCFAWFSCHVWFGIGVVRTTFLRGELEEKIYIKQPQGFEVEEKEDHICLLKKSLYELKQFSRQWYKKFDIFISSCDYSMSMYDGCVYFQKLKDGSFIYLLFYVNDMLITVKNLSEIHTWFNNDKKLPRMMTHVTWFNHVP